MPLESLHLLLDSGPESGREISIGQICSIGRAPENDLVLSDPLVSRRHARILRRGDGLVIEDLASAHGTLVMGERVKSRELRPGDRIEIGASVLRIGDANAESSEPDATDVLFAYDTSSSKNSSSIPISRGVSDPQAAIGRLDALLQVGIALQSERQIGRLLDRIGRSVLQTLDCERCGIFLRDEAGAAVVLTREGSDIANTAPDQLPFSRTLMSRAMDRGEALVTADAGRDRRFAGASLAAGTLRSAMVAPLWGRERILGSIVVENRGRAGAFGQDDLRLLVTLANLGGTAVENSRLIEEVSRETIERMTLMRFLSPAVADQVRRRGMSDGLRGERRMITVLFTDIRQFTSLSETLPPEELLEALNRAFGIMISAVIAEDGTVDKLTGDGLLAFFGAPLDQPDHAMRAVRCARAIREGCRGIATASGRPLPVGIGLSTGEATVGTIGTEERTEYTAIGDVVNVAARLVGRAEGGQILATAVVAGVCSPGEVRPLGKLELKGKAEGVEVVEVL